MSKILRRCLSLVLVIMLLASLTISGTLSASADTKTGDGLAAYAMTAYNEGWKYVWGGASYGAVDCSGLIYSYVGGGARVTEDMLYSSPESGYVSDGVPDIPGIGLWQPGHVGVYVGGGMAVDARDEISNVCYSAVSSKSWVMWFKVAGVSYDSSSVTNDNQSAENTNSSDNSTDTSSQNTADSVLERGDQGTSVNELQERLKTLGYFTDNTTYYFGSVTEAALMEFQSAAGLSATGVCDEATKNALFSDNAPVKYVEAESDSEEEVYEEPTTDSRELDSEIAQEVSDDDYTASDILEDSDEYSDNFAQFEEYTTDSDVTEISDTDVLYQVGDEDNEVSNIQFVLALLGYFDYDITGIYCDNTAYAVAQFQLDNDLDATGYVDEETMNYIYDKYNNRASSEDSDSEENTASDSSDEENVNYGYLSADMSGEEVTQMQQKLIDLRYLTGEPSGIYDDATVEAVKYFQEVAGYASSDYITEEQISLLYSSDAPQSPDYSYLQLGYSGKDVEDLQKTLVVWGYLSYSDISELGYYDYATENAVISAQQSLDLNVSGVVTPELTSVLKTSVQLSGESTDGSTDSNTDTSNTSSETAASDTDSSSTASEQSTAVTASASNASTASATSEAAAVDVPKTGSIDMLASKTFAVIAIGVSMLVIFFACTIHYWNVSMEKRRKRERKAMTVSVYRRRSM